MIIETDLRRTSLVASPSTPDGAHAVDAWLRLTLAAQFDPVLGEALPPVLLAALAHIS